jgi:hypothetical protein
VPIASHARTNGAGSVRRVGRRFHRDGVYVVMPTWLDFGR